MRNKSNVDDSLNQTSQMTEASSIKIIESRQFINWLAEQSVSLVFTSCDSGKIFFIGQKDSNNISAFQRNFPRSMGLAINGDDLYLSSLYQIWHFKRYFPSGGQNYTGYDCVYTPKTSHITADLDIHDMVIDSQGQLIFANTLFSCLAKLSKNYNFEVIWKPPFITKLAPEDRCHLNGLALREGNPRYVSMVSQTDIYDGWREHRQRGGLVMDIENNAVICENLSMPHSPRWYQDKLWVLEAGTGYFGYVDDKTGTFEKVTFCPGFLRGLSFINDYAVVGISCLRENSSLTNSIALNEHLAKSQVSARCGLQVIHLKTGNVEHWLEIQGPVREIYDVSILPQIKRPMAIGFMTDEIRRSFVLPPM